MQTQLVISMFLAAAFPTVTALVGIILARNEAKDLRNDLAELRGEITAIRERLARVEQKLGIAG